MRCSFLGDPRVERSSDFEVDHGWYVPCVSLLPQNSRLKSHDMATTLEMRQSDASVHRPGLQVTAPSRSEHLLQGLAPPVAGRRTAVSRVQSAVLDPLLTSSLGSSAQDTWTLEDSRILGSSPVYSNGIQSASPVRSHGGSDRLGTSVRDKCRAQGAVIVTRNGSLLESATSSHQASNSFGR